MSSGLTPLRPVSMRLIFDWCHPTIRAASPLVSPDRSRRARSSSPSLRRRTAGPCCTPASFHRHSSHQSAVQIRSSVAEFTASSDRYMHILGERQMWRHDGWHSGVQHRSGAFRPGGKGTVAMADHQEASVTLPSDPASVAAARRYVAEVLSEWGLPDDADTADSVRLIVSELATNAVQHTFGQSPTFTVDVRLERQEWLRVGVTDSHPAGPSGSRPPSSRTTAGAWSSSAG